MKAFLVAASLLSTLSAVKAQLFTVNCQPLTIQRSDPLLFPGIMSPHVHIVTGGTAFAQTESNAQARAAKATTCDKVLDNSNYWTPQLYHQNTNGTFNLVEMQGNAAYYISRACNFTAGATSCDSSQYPIAPPAGLRMVSGNPTLRTFDSNNFAQRAISHMCLKASTSTEYNSLPPEPCERLRAQVFFPSCWNGVDLDPPDHTSHMAFPAIGDYNTGVCPESHPVAIYSVFYEFFYDTSNIPDYNRLVYAMGDPTGYGLHGDFINGWTDQGALDRAMATCTGPNGVGDKGCSLNVGPNGPGSASPQTPQTPAPSEPVGLQGPLDQLPGDNPVTGTPVREASPMANPPLSPMEEIPPLSRRGFKKLRREG